MRSIRQGILSLAVLAMVCASRPAWGQIPTPSTAAPTDSFIPPPFSPRRAFLRSMVIPGWGQAYVGSPTRGAVYFSMAAGSFWMTYVAHRQRGDTEDEQDWLRETGQIGPTEETDFNIARGSHFEDWAALSIFLVFLSGADAYVTAYLSDFDERVGVMPGQAGGVQFQAHIPVGATR